MPVRKIPKNYLGVTGDFSSQKNDATLGFESLLEKDLMTLLEFDETVESFEEQPVKVSVPGHKKPYTPDILIRYRADPVTHAERKPLLGEVKHTEFLEKKKAEYEPKFAAAEIFAAERGWDFRPITEEEIRVPRLDNYKFLRAYRNLEVGVADAQLILNSVAIAGVRSTVRAVIRAIASRDEEIMRWTPIVWAMVCQRSLATDLDTKFGDDVEIWVP